MFKKIKDYGSADARAAYMKIKRHRFSLLREFSPLRGCFITYYQKEDQLYKEYESWVQDIISIIESSDLPKRSKESLLVWENFQASQKGPTAPILLKHYDEDVVRGILRQEIKLGLNEKKMILEVYNDLMDYLTQFVKIDIDNINFEEAWRELPNTTLRGFPFMGEGSKWDEEIIKIGGSTAESAYNWYKSDPEFICYPGFRIQGKPPVKGAKLRLIFIPPVHSQYLDVGLIRESMNQLKKAPPFAGWLSPKERASVINKQIKIAKLKECTLIQLDYSAFDKSIAPFFQEVISNAFIEFAVKDTNNIAAKRAEFFKKFRSTQGVLLSDQSNKVYFYKAPNQLASGEKRTQHDGSLINLLLNGLIQKYLFKTKINWELTLALGDDASLPVPNKLMAELGYKEILKGIEKFLAKFKFGMNASKAYPNTDLAFLQKIWEPSKGLNGWGSWTRNLSSFLFREKMPPKIKGIRIPVMEIISQVTILSEPFSYNGTTLAGVPDYVAGLWIRKDKGLRTILKLAKEHGVKSPHEFFKALIKMSSANTQDILEWLDIHSYDHTGVSEALLNGTKDFGEVFPILKYLLESNESLDDVFEGKSAFSFSYEYKWTSSDEYIEDSAS